MMQYHVAVGSLQHHLHEAKSTAVVKSACDAALLCNQKHGLGLLLPSKSQRRLCSRAFHRIQVYCCVVVRSSKPACILSPCCEQR